MRPPLKKLFPIVAFIAVALVSLAMAGFAYFATQEATRIKFEAMADDALNRIESRVDLHLSLLRATQALFGARNGKVSAAEFEAFFDALDIDGNFAGLHGIGYLRLVKAGDEAAVEREIRENFGLARKSYPRSDQPWRAAGPWGSPRARGLTPGGRDLCRGLSVEGGQGPARALLALCPDIADVRRIEHPGFDWGLHILRNLGKGMIGPAAAAA